MKNNVLLVVLLLDLVVLLFLLTLTVHHNEIIKLVKITIDNMKKQDRQELIEFIKDIDNNDDN